LTVSELLRSDPPSPPRRGRLSSPPFSQGPDTTPDERQQGPNRGGGTKDLSLPAQGPRFAMPIRDHHRPGVAYRHTLLGRVTVRVKGLAAAGGRSPQDPAVVLEGTQPQQQFVMRVLRPAPGQGIAGGRRQNRGALAAEPGRHFRRIEVV